MRLGQVTDLRQWHELSSSNAFPAANLESHPLNRRNKFFDSIGPGKVATPRSIVGEEILAQGGQPVEVDKEHIHPYAHYGYVYCMLLLKGGPYSESGGDILISGGGDGTIKIWQLADVGDEGLRHLETLENGDNSVLSMALDGTFLYSGRLEGDVDVWDLDTCQLIRTVKAHDADVLTVAVGPELILAGGSTGWAKVVSQMFSAVAIY